MGLLSRDSASTYFPKGKGSKPPCLDEASGVAALGGQGGSGLELRGLPRGFWVHRPPPPPLETEWKRLPDSKGVGKASQQDNNRNKTILAGKFFR